MEKQTTPEVATLSGIGLRRRSFISRLLKLPAPLHGVGVERNIPVSMPDGIRLFSDHYYPKAAGEFPTIFIRLPYGRGKEAALWGGYPMGEMPAQRFAERGYHVLVQGARGCLNSEGVFNPHLNEAADGQATLAWIEQQPWFNGILGTWGPSYLGYMQWATVAGGASSLKAMLPFITSSENFSVSHPDGAFGLETRLRWARDMYALNRTHRQPLWKKIGQRFSGKAEESLQVAFDHLPLLEADTVAAGEPIPFFRELISNDQAEDPYWKSRDHSQSVAQITAPVHLIGGWYDYYLRGLLRDYHVLNTAGRRPHLTIGPWHHAHANGLMTGLREGLNWFDTHLKGEQSNVREKAVRLYVMGADEWQEFDDFPPPAVESRYYLQPEGGLLPEAPAVEAATDHYRYDPADPTPAVGGALLALRGAGAQDNLPLEARLDVLVYTSPELTEAVEIIGPVHMTLFVRSSLNHTDFFARLNDVSPDGHSSNICDGLFRLEPGKGEVQPDGSLLVHIDMWATAHRFLSGHRLRLLISSGAHPRWSRNLGFGEDVARGVRMAIAEQTIYHDATHPSALILPITLEG